MPETAQSKLAKEEIGEFLDYLFEGNEGHVYSPVKSPTSGAWQQYFFQWPEQRDSIVSHIIRTQRYADTYLSPSLFNDGSSAERSNWRGTQFIWCEFDGNAPKSPPRGIPDPTFRLQSSENGHEHWYWRLSNFESDYRILEGLSKKLTYTLDADLSGWDAVQVLRPPHTMHHESGRRVKVLQAERSHYDYVDFKNLVEIPEEAIVSLEIAAKELDVAEIAARYTWPTDAKKLFARRQQKVGSRSSALMKLGFYCIEMGMTNEEAYTILQDADSRWKKYTSRDPDSRTKRLIGIISRARSKIGLQAELLLPIEKEPFYMLGDFLSMEIKVNWIFKDLFSEQGLGIISSAPGSGKSHLSILMKMKMILQQKFLVWDYAGPVAPIRSGFFSLEMSHAEVRLFIDQMLPDFTPEQIEILKQNFGVFPQGYTWPLYVKENQQTLLEIVDQHELKDITIDSLYAVTGGLQEDKTNKVFEFINRELRTRRGCSVWLIHHNRKAPNEGPRKPKDLSDLYGDTFITSHALTVLSLWTRSKKSIEVMNFKSRLAQETDNFIIQRQGSFNWKVVGYSSDVSEEEEGDENDSNSSKRSGKIGM